MQEIRGRRGIEEAGSCIVEERRHMVQGTGIRGLRYARN